MSCTHATGPGDHDGEGSVRPPDMKEGAASRREAVERAGPGIPAVRLRTVAVVNSAILVR